MAIKNLSNYRVGKSYKFDIKGHGIKLVKVLAKGDHKLQLLINDIQDEVRTPWFTSEELSTVEVKNIAPNNFHAVRIAVAKDKVDEPKKVEEPTSKPIEKTEKLSTSEVKFNARPITKVEQVPIVEKSLTEKMYPKKEQDLEVKSEHIDTMEYAFKFCKRELRSILKDKGITLHSSCSWKEVFDAVRRLRK